MKEQLKEIGLRLQELREIREMTEEQVADALGLTLNEYLAYENGEKDFSISFMYNVAKIFEVDVFNLLSGHSPNLTDCSVVRKGHEFYVKREGSYDYKHLAYTFKDKKAEPFFVEINPGEGEDKVLSHEGQEFDFVLSGDMRLTIGSMVYDLHAGDSVYFNSKIPHGLKSIGDKPLKFIAVVIK